MRLFTIGEDFTVELNKEWILLIPEFKVLVHRDKGGKESPGDYDGRKKLKAKRELAFIYFDLDFTSPLYHWDEFERRQEAMKYAGLKEKDMDAELMAAHSRYNELLLQSAPSLKTLRALEKSLTAFNAHLESVDFTKTDKKGELVHDPGQYLGNMKKINEGFDAIDKFRKRVIEEMKGDQSIRGSNTLGRNEGKRKQGWDETGASDNDDLAKEKLAAEARAPQTSFRDIAYLLKGEDGKRLVADDGSSIDEEENNLNEED